MQQQSRVKASSPFGGVIGKSHGRKNDKKIASIYSHGGASSPFDLDIGAKKGNRVKSTGGGTSNVISDLNLAMEKHFKRATGNQGLKFLMN